MSHLTINPRITGILLKILYYRYDNTDYSLAVGPIGAKALLSLGLSSKVEASLKKFLRAMKKLQKNEKAKMLELLIVQLRKDENRALMELLNTKDILKIAKDVLIDRTIKQYENNNWNVYGDYIKHWRPDLIEALKENGIYYDEGSQLLSYANNPIKISFEHYLSESFIKAKFGEQLYEELKNEINKAYSHGLFTATIILSRKLVENFLIDILRKKYPPSNSGLEIYYIPAQGRFRDLSDLINELDGRKQDFEPDVETVKSILELTNHMREKANSGAHSIVFYADKNDIESLKIPELIDRLSYLEDRI